MSDSSELGYSDSAPGNLQSGGPPPSNPKRVKFFSEAGSTGKCKVVAVKKNEFSTLPDYLSTAFCVPVRNIRTPRGKHSISSFDDLQQDGKYVCYSKVKGKVRGVDVTPRTWNAGNKPALQRVSFMNEPGSDVARSLPPIGSRSDPGTMGHSRRPKKLTIIRNNNSNRRFVFLLNRKTEQNFNSFLQDVSTSLDCECGKLFTEDGEPIQSLTDVIRGPDCYILAEESERFVPLGKSGRLAKPLKPVAAWIDKKGARTRGRWAVSITTSDRQDAGSTANVFITVYGSKSCTMPIPLNVADGDCFRCGSTDSSEINVGNIGKVYKIRLSHDNAGDDADWLCDEVKLKDVHTSEELNFECRRWIGCHNDNMELCRELPASRPGESDPPVIRYNITVHTGDLWNASTEATILVTLYGEHGDTGPRILARENVQDKFKKGQIDEFQVEAVYLGKLKRVIIGHDAGGPGHGWFLEKLTVKESGGRTDNKWDFYCNRWLDEGEEDGKVVRDLKPCGENLHEQIEKQTWEYEKWKFENGNEVRLYSVTSHRPLRIKPDATVDADGDYDDPLAYSVLKKQSIFRMIARRSNVRVFQSVNHEKFHLAIDNAKLLGQGRGGAFCEVRLHPQPNYTVALESIKFPGQYMSVKSSGKLEDPRAGGTELQLNRLFYAYCKGTLRHQGVVMLCTSLTQTLTVNVDDELVGTGKRNQVAYFRVHKVAEGGVRMFESLAFPKKFIRMKEGRCDLKGTGDDYCKFRCHRTRDESYITLESMFNRGIHLGMMPDGVVKPTIETGDVNTRIHIEVIEFGCKKGEEHKKKAPVAMETTPRRKRAPLAPIASLPPEKAPKETPREESAHSHFEEGDWKVWINTMETAQNAEVKLVVYGDEGCSGPIILGGAGEGEMFKCGSQDQFKINPGALGKIYKIRLELAGTDDRKPQCWKVKDVKLKDMTNRVNYKFKFNRWISRQHDDHDLMRELPVVRPKEPVLPAEDSGWNAPVLVYRVEVHTANEPGADTDANVFLTVFGERGDWGKRNLRHSNNENKFDEGQVDIFHVEAVSLGKLKYCELAHDAPDTYEGWLCEKIIIRESDEATHEWVFPCGKWLDGGIDECKTERVLELEDHLQVPRSHRMITSGLLVILL